MGTERMRTYVATLLLVAVVATVYSQDVVEIECGQDAITAKIQKEVVTSAGYLKEDIHLNDKGCAFNGEDGEFFVSVIPPLTSCDTFFTVNETHVQFTNTISSMDTGDSYPLGVVVGAQKSEQVLSAFIACTYRIDLRVSTLFFPNITIIPIRVPDTFGVGEFKVAMSLYTDATYRTPYIDPPTLNPDETLFVGVNIVNEASPDAYLLIERCWGTVYEDAESLPSYPLIDDDVRSQSKETAKSRSPRTVSLTSHCGGHLCSSLSAATKTTSPYGFTVICRFASTENVNPLVPREGDVR